MRDPLRHRLLRSLREDWGKYTALFLFLFVLISFTSGYFVADGSMKRAYDESFEKYSIEDGHFTVKAPLTAEQIAKLEQDRNVTIAPLEYLDRETEAEHTVRFYRPREEMNLLDVMDGRLPEAAGEIILDRLYAENNEIAIGDTFRVDGTDYTVTGVAAFSDYSALFKSNNDMMFDANKFTVAVVTGETFDALGGVGLQHNYAWRWNDDLTASEARAASTGLMGAVYRTAELTDFLPQYRNQAIIFAGDDMGGDYAMFQALIYIVMVILAFIFAVTTRSTIERECGTVGTLRASGYTRFELLRHYLTLPLLGTFTAAVLGNIVGYAWMKKITTGMYYHSYSLPTYKTVWNGEAFVLTTVIPLVIIAVVTSLVLWRTLKLPPLQFLRGELRAEKKQAVVKLRHGAFLNRFGTRILLQNLPAYAILALGILFASVLLMFGCMFSPLLRHFNDTVVNAKFAEYQYVLTEQAETNVPGAEKYCITSLQNNKKETITIYGVEPGSRYIPEVTDTALISEGYLLKYGFKAGDTLYLREQFAPSNYYPVTIGGTIDYPASLSIFMPIDQFRDLFDLPEDSFNGWFSDEKLEDLDEHAVATVVTQADLTVMADQLEDSMGRIFPLFGGFAVVLYVLMMYLLSKMILERNARTISLLKILGYTDREAGRLFHRATTLVVLVSILISLPISYWLIKIIYRAVMLEYPGWLTLWIAPWIWPFMIALGLGCWFGVMALQRRTIRRIPMGEALKNQD